jgi:hypothetical protein
MRSRRDSGFGPEASGDDMTKQDTGAFGAFLREELESERRWDHLFARSQDVLARMAEEADEEYRAGLTEPLDVETFPW